MSKQPQPVASPPEDVFCTAVIPTVGRDTLARAVESVLGQELPGAAFELLVINDAGQTLPPASWQTDSRVRVIDTNRRERSVARNTGAALARGRYLHFLDDDDWIAPGAYHRLSKLSQSSQAAWLYGMTQLVDRQSQPLIKLRHGLRGNCFVQAMAGEWIPLQASLIRRDAFLRVGGFNPQLAGPEDNDLLRRVLLEEEVDEAAHIVANIVIGEVGSTTNYDRHPEASRRAREQILDLPGAYRRMRTSAGSAFWRARLLRVYLTSVVWNLQHRRLLRAASRAAHALAAAASAGPALFSGAFWREVARPYASLTFENGIREARKAQGNDL